jgi:hypothetical protein
MESAGFSIETAALAIQFPSKAVQFQQIGPEKGDSG